MQFPLSYWDFGIWLAANAIILLMVSAILSSYHRRYFGIEKRNLRIVAAILGILFMVVVMIQGYHALMTLQP